MLTHGKTSDVAEPHLKWTVVGEVRVELTWVSPTDFKSVASAIPPLARF